MNDRRYLIVLTTSMAACASPPRIPPNPLTEADHAVVGCYQVELSLDAPAVIRQFEIQLDTADGLDGRRVQLLTPLPDSVRGLGFFWSFDGQSLRVKSWAGREGQGLELRASGPGDTLVGAARWHWRFDRSDRDSSSVQLRRHACA